MANVATRTWDRVHGGSPLSPQPCVLIVDALEESQEVFRAALEARGVRVLTADEAETGLTLAQRHQPDVIVLDVDGANAGRRACDDLLAHSRRDDRQLVVLGKTCRSRDQDRGLFVSKPYHYAPLIRKIEALLDQVRLRVLASG